MRSGWEYWYCEGLAYPVVGDGLGGFVDDQVDPGSPLQGADIAPLAADDAAFHLFVR